MDFKYSWGVYDYKNRTVLDNIAYSFYMDTRGNHGDSFYGQKEFATLDELSELREPFYDKAIWEIRKQKIKNINAKIK